MIDAIRKSLEQSLELFHKTENGRVVSGPGDFEFLTRKCLVDQTFPPTVRALMIALSALECVAEKRGFKIEDIRIGGVVSLGETKKQSALSALEQIAKELGIQETGEK